MVMRFFIFIAKLWNLWNREIEELGLENEFAERVKREN